MADGYIHAYNGSGRIANESVSPTVNSPLRNKSLFYNYNYKHYKIGIS